MAASLSGTVTGVNAASLDAAPNFPRTAFVEQSLREFGIPLHDFKVWDSLQQLPTAGAADDLGLAAGTYGTNAPQIETGDVKAAGATTRRARTIYPLPDTYKDGESVQIRVFAGMETTVADTTATVDIEVYQLKDDDSISADLCTQTPLSINSLTKANKDFAITPTGLVAGSRLDIRVSVAVNDGATGTAVNGVIDKISLRCDTQP